MKKYYVIALYILIVNSYTIAQNLNLYTGDYSIHEECLDNFGFSYIKDYNIIIEIPESDTSDLIMILNQHGFDTLKLSFFENSKFNVFSQSNKEVYQPSTITGHVEYLNDSLFFNYYDGSLYGLYECIAKGKKIPNAINLIDKGLFNLQYHRLNQYILISETIQSFIIYNVLGEIVKSGTQQEISIEDLPNGMYIIKIKTVDNVILYSKFLK